MSSRAAGPAAIECSPAATWKTLPLGALTIEDGLWARRQRVNREKALPHGFRMLEQAGNFENLRIAAGRSDASYRGPVFMDSDVYKWLEAAAWEVGRAPSATLGGLIDAAVELVEAAQCEDGYLNSYYQVAEPGKRWIDFAQGHELYCAGHLIQAAVALRRAADDERLLRVARRFVDHIDGEFGPEKRVVVPGHPEIEMALVELFRETGERRYLDLAKFFVDHRGRGLLGPGRFNSSAYYQDRIPVREATELEGHAVRGLYLTTGVADLYLETGEQALFEALTRLWHDLVARKLYVTGGVGARHLAESFGQPYELPNDLAYNETCAAIASITWNWRMLLATGQARYADLIERTLYNAFLGGVSLDGKLYFYANPVSSRGDPERISRGGPERRPWHLVACCPPNVMRTLASLGHYFASRSPSGLQVHQYGPARIEADLGGGQELLLRMESAFPWEGQVRIAVERSSARPWTLSLRVPGWSPTASVRLDGQLLDAKPSANGYLELERAWQDGDVVELKLSMEPRLVEAHPWIESTRGCVAIERGPLVYCLEQPDQPEARVFDLELDAGAPLTPARRNDLLEGVTTIRAAGNRVDPAHWDGRLYRPLGAEPEPTRRPTDLTAIPYYAWANRGPSAMRVWIPRAGSEST